ncbi:type I polyketide synthase, partial [Streptomyces tailanensis]|uniref:type I polyketide synthase n=1 Tax=Streptomyces tailanensis TaxID=2569858 RepID=UPI00122E4B23
FGISGTNAHLILEQAPIEEEPDAETAGTELPLLPFVLSGKTPEALAAQARRLLAHLAADPVPRILDIAYSLATSRAPLEHRAMFLAHDRDTLAREVTALTADATRATVAAAPAGTGADAVWVFPGQGAQWVGMAADLLEWHPVFARRIAECEEALAPVVDWSLRAVLRDEPGAPSLERVDVVQPVLFAVMVSLAEVWRASGVRPAAVVGHSQGEIAAACVAGALTLEDAARVVALRSQAIVCLAGSGGMVSLAVPEAEAAELIGAWAGAVSVASVNGPTATVVAGDTGALEELMAQCERREVRARRIPVDYASHSAHVEPLEGRLRELLAGIRPCAASIPMYSTVTGAQLSGEELDAGYWYTNLRQTVRFAPVIDALIGQGHGAFVEVSPHPVLAVPIGESLEQAGVAGVVTSTLHRNEDGFARFLASLCALHAARVPVDWQRFFESTGARRTELPTYAFQRKRFWLRPGAAAAYAGGAGMEAAGHPLLGAVMEMAGRDELVLTARLSLGTHPWLGGHAVHGAAVLPFAVVAEILLHAGARVDCPSIDHLTVTGAPVLTEDGALDLQVVVGEPKETGRRPVTVHGRDAGSGVAWQRLATALLGPRAEEPPAHGGQWPPAGAEPLADVYDELGGRGYDLGVLFQGVTAAWRRGEELFAEVSLPEESAEETAGYGLHPALLEAAVHPAVAVGEEAGPRVPRRWTGVRLHSQGAEALRVRITPAGPGEVRLALTDESDSPVATVDAVALDGLGHAEVSGAAPAQRVFGLRWTDEALPPAATRPRWGVLAGAAEDAASGTAPVFREVEAAAAAVASGEPVDAVLLHHRGAAELPVPEAALAGTARVLTSVQRWLLEERLGSTPLVVVTHRAVGPDADDAAAAPVWGLLRTAQSENPGRILLLDTDEDEPSAELLAQVLASGEPQVAVRGGRTLVPRLAAAGAGSAPRWTTEGTVLVTGGTGALGRRIAAHLVSHHGVSRLLLVSRRGGQAPGADAISAELSALGAHVTLAACDVADGRALAELLAGIPVEHPLTAVVHAAGRLDDSTVTGLTTAQLDAVAHSHVTGTWNLHEATRELPLDAFVLFSSVAATFGTPGRAAYAAGNAFLDALAGHRQALGLPAASLAWGLWDVADGLNSGLAQSERERYAADGFLPVGEEEGPALFDDALGTDLAVPVVVPLDLTALRSSRRLPAVLRGLVPVRERRRGKNAAEPLHRRLAALDPTQRYDLVLDLVRTEAAGVLGYAGPGDVPSTRTFQELGFDSLTAVELRNRLSTASGLRLPPTLVFDHPTPEAAAGRLLEEAAPAAEASLHPLLAELDALERRLAEATVDTDVRAAVRDRLRVVLSSWTETDGRDTATVSDIESASADELFALIDDQLGTST